MHEPRPAGVLPLVAAALLLALAGQATAIPAPAAHALEQSPATLGRLVWLACRARYAASAYLLCDEHAASTATTIPAARATDETVRTGVDPGSLPSSADEISVVKSTDHERS